MSSVLICQVVLASQQLVVFQMPPPSAPSQAMAGLVGCETTTLTRPATALPPPPLLRSGEGPSGVKRSGSSVVVDLAWVRREPDGSPRGILRICTAASTTQLGL